MPHRRTSVPAPTRLTAASDARGGAGPAVPPAPQWPAPQWPARQWPVADALPWLLALPLALPLTLSLALGCHREAPDQARSDAAAPTSGKAAEIAGGAPEAAGGEPHSEPTLAQQLAWGRAGETTRVQSNAFQHGDRWLASLTAEDDWLEELILDGGVVTDRGLEALTALPDLWHLRLRHSPITDSGLRRLAACPSLRIVNLPQCQASPEGVAALAGLAELRNLRLGGPRLGPKTADAVAQIRSLRGVHLIGVPIDDQGLRKIAALPKLQSLYLDDSAVSGAGWQWLFETHPRLHVHVNQHHLDRNHPGHHH